MQGKLRITANGTYSIPLNRTIIKLQRMVVGKAGVDWSLTLREGGTVMLVLVPSINEPVEFEYTAGSALTVTADGAEAGDVLILYEEV